MPIPTQEKMPWLQEGASKHVAIQQMFDEIAPTYDRVNGVISLSGHRRWRAAAVRQMNLKAGDDALDICCGTGDFLVALRKAVGPEGRVVGLDFSGQMLAQARPKIDKATRLIQGDACALPFPEGEFEGVTVGWGIRNVRDIDLAHREAFRVLSRGGRFASLDMAIPQNRLLRVVSGFIFKRFVPAIGALIGRSTAYRYLPESTDRFRTRIELEDSMTRAGFQSVGHRDLFFGNICLHFGTKPL